MLEEPRQGSSYKEERAPDATAAAQVSEPRHHACRGAAALELTERTLCGPGAVGTAAAAEGLALSGVRAARVLSDEEVQPVAHTAASVRWVLHRTTAQRSRGGPFGAFEFVAGNAQQAVDQSLVAHLTALAGEQLVDPSFARRLWVYEPLRAQAVLPQVAEAAGREALVVDEDAVGRELGVAFEKASALLGRKVGPLSDEDVADAEVLILTTSDAHDVAIRAAQALAGRVECGVIATTMLRPFPAKALADAVGNRRLVLLEPAWVRGRLEGSVRAALGDADRALPCVDPFGPNPTASVHAALELGAEPKPSLAPESPRFVMGVVPAGSRAEDLLCDVASRLADAAPITVAAVESSDGMSTRMAIGRGRIGSSAITSIDLLLTADPVLIDAPKLVAELVEGGVVVIASAAQSAEAVWSELTPGQRDALRQRSAKVYWLDLRAKAADELYSPNDSWIRLQQALLETGAPGLAERLGLDEKRIRGLSGGAELRPIPLSASTAPRVARSVRRRPLVPQAAQTPAAAHWRSALRRFHVSGQGAAGPAALLPLAPAAVSAWLAAGAEQQLPLIIDRSAPTLVAPLASRLSAALGSGGGVVAEHFPRLMAAITHELAKVQHAAPTGEILEGAIARFASEFELSAAAKKSLDEELAALRQAIPKTGSLLGLSSHAHLELYIAVVLAERERRTAPLVAVIQGLAEQLADRMRLEASRSPRARSADGLSAVLGEGASFVDPAALAKSLPVARGPRPLDEARKQRIARALATLRRFISDAPKASKLVLVHSGNVPDGFDAAHTERVRHGAGFEVACGIFDGVAQRMTEVFRALRVARLEIDRAYDPSLHDEGIAELEWRGFNRDEMLLMPPIVVVESSDRVWKSSLDSLSRLLRSGRPIHVLLEESAALSGQPGLGYLLVAHREALVLQGTLARPLHLADGLARMATSLRPSVAVVAPRPPPGPMPAWLPLSANLEGRALPPFLYDPDAGESWAECFDISENPQPDLPWPTAALEVEAADDGSSSLEVPFTFADAAALGLEMRAHFWQIPPEAWNDDQIELGAYLQLSASQGLERLPFIWVVGEDGQLARAVVSRELAFACRERLRIWHVIQELGGSANEHARRAAELARRSAEAEALLLRRELETEHAAELDRVRNEEASIALSRLAEALMNPGAVLHATSALASPPPPPKPASAPEPEPLAAVAGPAVAAVEEEAVSFSDPYIDTPLCTSCNECLNVNPLMFKYNGDKQAVLTDAKLGTFKQLVVAAEKCPALCIHPGVPRKDDATANDDLVARAARFN